MKKLLLKTRSAASSTCSRRLRTQPALLHIHELKAGRWRKLTSAMNAAEESKERMISLYGECGTKSAAKQKWTKNWKNRCRLVNDYGHITGECVHSDKVSAVSSWSRLSRLSSDKVSTVSSWSRLSRLSSASLLIHCTTVYITAQILCYSHLWAKQI